MSKIQVEKISEEQKVQMEIPKVAAARGVWSVWECEPSQFDWHYPQTEVAYVYEGKVKVKTANEEVEINSGDLVTFPKDLSCEWNIIESIKKVYTFK